MYDVAKCSRIQKVYLKTFAVCLYFKSLKDFKFLNLQSFDIFHIYSGIQAVQR